MDTVAMADIRELLTTSTSFLLVDWPDRDVPDTLARYGFRVISNDGPGPDEYNSYELVGGEVHVRPVDGPADRVDIVYSHRPIEELPEIVERARVLNARAVWLQSGSAEAKNMVESAGLIYVDSPYLPEAVRETLAL